MIRLLNVFNIDEVCTFFFRASIWWKYLDEESVLPPPYTIFYLIHKVLRFAYDKIIDACLLKNATSEAQDVESPTLKKKRDQEQRLALDKSTFEKRYTHLMLTLINAPDKDKIGS